MTQMLFGPLVAIGLLLLAKWMFNYLDGDQTSQPRQTTHDQHYQ